MTPKRKPTLHDKLLMREAKASAQLAMKKAKEEAMSPEFQLIYALGCNEGLETAARIVDDEYASWGGGGNVAAACHMMAVQIRMRKVKP